MSGSLWAVTGITHVHVDGIGALPSTSVILIERRVDYMKVFACYDGKVKDVPHGENVMYSVLYRDSHVVTASLVSLLRMCTRSPWLGAIVVNIEPRTCTGLCSGSYGEHLPSVCGCVRVYNREVPI